MNAEELKVLSCAIGASIGVFIGGVNGIMYALLVFISLDYLTGVAVAVKRKALSSEVGFWGLIKKVGILALVGVGNVIDVHILGDGAVFRTAVIFFFIANEGISMLENFANIGILVPDSLKDMLAQLKETKGK